MPGPRSQVVVLAREEREKLEQVARAATSEQRAALRARIVLRAAGGMGVAESARQLGVTDQTARKWRTRFIGEGLDGLADRSRCGRPVRIDGVVRCQVISLACRPVPEDYHRNEWTLASLRQALIEAELLDAISTSTVGRILSEADFRPHRYHLWVHSPDPPLHASWCNQVECWFSILARRVLRRADFRSLDDLVEHVLGFIDHWNREERKPFRWTFKGYPVQTGLEHKEISWPRTASCNSPRLGCAHCCAPHRGTTISKSSVEGASSRC